jgi:hypothetical protein
MPRAPAPAVTATAASTISAIPGAIAVVPDATSALHTPGSPLRGFEAGAGGAPDIGDRGCPSRADSNAGLPTFDLSVITVTG